VGGRAARAAASGVPAAAAPAGSSSSGEGARCAGCVRGGPVCVCGGGERSPSVVGTTAVFSPRRSRGAMRARGEANPAFAGPPPARPPPPVAPHPVGPHPVAPPALRSVLLWRELLAVTRNPADVAGRMLIFTWIAVLVGARPDGRAAGWPADCSPSSPRLEAYVGTQTLSRRAPRPCTLARLAAERGYHPPALAMLLATTPLQRGHARP
jgi:hypothetical protein